MYHLYPHDLALLKGSGFGAYRFSIEWARIEPEEGFFSTAALDHYRRMIAGRCSRTVSVPIVTFHHFTAPLWFTRDGGWKEPKSRGSFRALLRACGACAWRSHFLRLHDQRTKYRIDDPAMRLAWQGDARDAGSILRRNRAALRRDAGALGAVSPCDGYAATPQLIAAHRKGYEALKSAGHRWPNRHHARIARSAGEPAESCFATPRPNYIEDQFLESLRGDDFIGVQTYTADVFGPEGSCSNARTEARAHPDGIRILSGGTRCNRAQGRARHRMSGIRDRERHRHSRRSRAASLIRAARSKACTPRSPQVSIFAAISIGRCLIITNGWKATARNSASSPSTGQRRRASRNPRRIGSDRSHETTRSTDETISRTYPVREITSSRGSGCELLGVAGPNKASNRWQPSRRPIRNLQECEYKACL